MHQLAVNWETRRDVQSWHSHVGKQPWADKGSRWKNEAANRRVNSRTRAKTSGNTASQSLRAQAAFKSIPDAQIQIVWQPGSFEAYLVRVANGEDFWTHPRKIISLHRVPDSLSKRASANYLGAVQTIQWNELSRLQVADERHASGLDHEYDAELPIRKTYWQCEVTLWQRWTSTHVDFVLRSGWEWAWHFLPWKIAASECYANEEVWWVCKRGLGASWVLKAA